METLRMWWLVALGCGLAGCVTQGGEQCQVADASVVDGGDDPDLATGKAKTDLCITASSHNGAWPSCRNDVSACCVDRAKNGSNAGVCYAQCSLDKFGLARGTVWDAARITSTSTTAPDGGVTVTETWNVNIDLAKAFSTFLTKEPTISAQLLKPNSVTIDEGDTTKSLHGIRVVAGATNGLLSYSGTTYVYDEELGTYEEVPGTPTYFLGITLPMVPNAAPSTYDPSVEPIATDCRGYAEKYGDNSGKDESLVPLVDGGFYPGGPSRNSTTWRVLHAERSVVTSYDAGTTYALSKIDWSDYGSSYTQSPSNTYPAVFAVQTRADVSDWRKYMATYVDLEGSYTLTDVEGASWKVAGAEGRLDFVAGAWRARTAGQTCKADADCRSNSCVCASASDPTDAVAKKCCTESLTCAEVVVPFCDGSTQVATPTLSTYPKITATSCKLKWSAKATRCGFNEASEDAAYWNSLGNGGTKPELLCSEIKQDAVNAFGQILCNGWNKFYQNSTDDSAVNDLLASPLQVLQNKLVSGIVAMSDSTAIADSTLAQRPCLSKATFKWVRAEPVDCSSLSSGVKKGAAYRLEKRYPVYPAASFDASCTGG